MKRAVLRTLAVTAVIVIGGIAWLVTTAPPVPAGADRIIEEVFASDLPELVTGETGTAMSGDVSIWYERIAPVEAPRGTVLLIMGAGGTALGWPDYFYRPLVDAGYEVVRFDNRGLGMSDWMAGWSPDDPYDLEDMALDALAVLDELGVERAHLVGISMGGMIGQRLAISHGDRVASLTSISSSGYAADPAFPDLLRPFGREVGKLALRYALIPSERSQMKFGVGLMQMLTGQGQADVDVASIVVAGRYEAVRRRGTSPGGTDQHLAAVEASGSRYDELGSISVPTLVVHGLADPLFDVAHAETYAALIPHAELLVIEGLGHVLPIEHTPRVVEAILRLLGSGETSVGGQTEGGRGSAVRRSLHPGKLAFGLGSNPKPGRRR